MAPPHDIEVFFDAACAICVREIRMLERLDRHGRIGLVDISTPDFDPAAVGVTWNALMDGMHGRLPDGRPARTPWSP